MVVVVSRGVLCGLSNDDDDADADDAGRVKNDDTTPGLSLPPSCTNSAESEANDGSDDEDVEEDDDDIEKNDGDDSEGDKGFADLEET